MTTPSGEKNDLPLVNPVFEEEKQWFVVYTRSRAEKKVLEEMKYLGIEAYVPLQKVVRQWKDRRKTIEEPLIRCYVFVRLNPMKRDLVFQSIHAVHYVTFSGRPATIPDQQIESLKRLITAEVPIEATLQQFRPGEKVRVFYGPMSGVSGEFISLGSEKRFLLRIDNLGYSLVATIPAAWVEKVE
jgi:transcriptional antiterminator RfaH